MTDVLPHHLLLRLYDFTSQLVGAESFEDAAGLFRRELRFFGIDGYACGEVDLDDPTRTVMAHAEWPADWLGFYLGERLHESDPLMDRLQTARRPFTWDETWNTFEAKRWRQAVLSYGWRSGLAVPLPRAGRRVGLVSLVSMNDGPGREENALLATMGALFYERGRGLGIGKAGASARALVRPALTAREIACLQAVASGLDDGGVGMKVGIAASTAHEHVERAKRKLNARTRAQAVALAVAMGIIEP